MGRFDRARNLVWVLLVGLLTWLLAWWVGPPGGPSAANDATAPRPVQPVVSAHRGGDTGEHEASPVEVGEEVGPFRGVQTKLRNGMHVILVPVDAGTEVGAWVVVRAGAAHDPPSHPGTAHLVEHLLHNGTRELSTRDWATERPWREREGELLAALASTRQRSQRERLLEELDEAEALADGPAVPGELNRALVAIGARNANAHTSLEMTAFHATLPSVALEPWAHLMAEQLGDPVWRGFRNERRLVQDEIRLRGNLAHLGADEAVRRRLFRDHPYGNPIGGTIQALHETHPAVLQEFWAEHYVPGNMAVVVVGPIHVPRVLSVLEESFGRLPEAPVPESRLEQVPEWVGRDYVDADQPEVTVVEWPLGALAPGEAEALEMFAYDVLLALPREDRPRTGLLRLRHTSVLWVQVACEARPDCVRDVVEGVQRALRPTSPTEPRRRAFRVATVAASVRRHIRSLESFDEQARVLAETWARGASLGDARASLRHLEALTPERVTEVARARVSPWEMVATLPMARAPSPGPTESGLVDVQPEHASAFYQRIVAWPRPQVGPGWVREGAEYEVVDGVIAVFNPYNDLFELELHYPRGWAGDPALCAALQDYETKSEWMLDNFLHGVSGMIRCETDAVTITLSGRAADARRAVGTLRDLALASIHEVRSFAPCHTRRVAEDLAAWGSAAPGLRAHEELPSPSRMTAAIRSVLGLRPEVRYFGPHSAGEIARWIPTALLPPVARVAADRPSGITVLVHEGAGRHVDAARALPDDPEQVGERLLYDLWLDGADGAVFRLVREGHGATYAVGGGVSEAERGRPPFAHAWTREVAAAERVRVARLLVEAHSPSPVDHAAWERLAEKLDAFEEKRSWLRGLPHDVSRWRSRGVEGDGREQAHRAALGVTRERFEDYLEQVSAEPLFIELQVPSGTDLSPLTEIGALRSPAELGLSP